MPQLKIRLCLGGNDIFEVLKFIMSDAIKKTSIIGRLCRWYVSTALIVFNTILFVLFLASLVFVVLKVYKSADPNLDESFIKIRAKLVGLTIAEERLLTRETWDDQWEYSPWVGFRERPRKGKYVNVSAEGFRNTIGNPEKGDLVLMMGGSTTFGYNVTDSQTVASFLQGEFNRMGRSVIVLNYGRGFYWSKQEVTLLNMLLSAGLRPKAVIFLDGLNEFQIDPYYSREMSFAFERIQKKYPWRTLSDIVDFLGETATYYTFRKIPSIRYNQRLELATPAKGNQQYLEQVQVAKALCDKYQILPFFFLQPIPGFRNNFGRHPLLRDQFTISVLENRVAGYELLTQSLPSNITDLSGLLEGYENQPFVDGVHYSPDISKRIARIIFERVNPQVGIDQHMLQ
jgi:hypothetical protein